LVAPPIAKSSNFLPPLIAATKHRGSEGNFEEIQGPLSNALALDKPSPTADQTEARQSLRTYEHHYARTKPNAFSPVLVTRLGRLLIFTPAYLKLSSSD
jgi:hypothetical protein